jgi:hypothetical protein
MGIETIKKAVAAAALAIAGVTATFSAAAADNEFDSTEIGAIAGSVAAGFAGVYAVWKLKNED